MGTAVARAGGEKNPHQSLGKGKEPCDNMNKCVVGPEGECSGEGIGGRGLGWCLAREPRAKVNFKQSQRTRWGLGCEDQNRGKRPETERVCGVERQRSKVSGWIESHILIIIINNSKLPNLWLQVSGYIMFSGVILGHGIGGMCLYPWPGSVWVFGKKKTHTKSGYFKSMSLTSAIDTPRTDSESQPA